MLPSLRGSVPQPLGGQRPPQPPTRPSLRGQSPRGRVSCAAESSLRREQLWGKLRAGLTGSRAVAWTPGRAHRNTLPRVSDKRNSCFLTTASLCCQWRRRPGQRKTEGGRPGEKPPHSGALPHATSSRAFSTLQSPKKDAREGGICSLSFQSTFRLNGLITASRGHATARRPRTCPPPPQA